MPKKSQAGPTPTGRRAKTQKARARWSKVKAGRRRAAIQQGLISTDGRTTPRHFDPVTADRICERYADGEPMLSILHTPGYPTGGQFYVWVETIPEIAKKWERARRARAHALSEETLNIADASMKGHPAFIPAHALRVKTRQWLAAKLRPDVYGEHMNLKHDGVLSLAAISQQLKQRQVEPPELIDGKTGKLVDAETDA